MSQAASVYPEPVEGEEASVLAHRGKLLVGLVVLLGALGYFGYMAFQSATVYYYTVGEMADVGATPEGKVVRVSGKLVPDSFSRPEGSTVAYFSLTDGTETLSAAHEGVIPDLFFNEHSDIILEGAHRPGDVFRSENVIVKCPSKYVAVGSEG